MKTLVVFTNDNGGPPKQNASDNGPNLKGGKGTSWEGGNRVPMVMSLPGVLPAGARYGEVVSRPGSRNTPRPGGMKANTGSRPAVRGT
jgi:arylsulfatase A-like enzyme